MDMIDRMTCDGTLSPDAAHSLDEGKMLGVLVVKDRNGSVGYLAGFSGNVGGQSCLPGFVPPLYDLTAPDGDFKKGEAELDKLNQEIRTLQSSPEYACLKARLSEKERALENEISGMKAAMALSKRERDEIRHETADPARLAVLIKQSQFQKAELHRIKERGRQEISGLRSALQRFENEISRLKKLRTSKSEMLQKWIFTQYVVSDATGNRKSIDEIFADRGLIPPGGTGDCAAPKLLNHAYLHDLTPLAMGEFWYGASPSTAVRTHGHFYPSCTSKCGPLLAFMLNGIDVHTTEVPSISTAICTSPADPAIIHEDESVIVASKPSGMPSVPGLDGKESLLEWLQKRQKSAEAVHRLDMDTSGIMLFAKNSEAAINLRNQFAEHTVRKAYLARLSPADCHKFAVNCTKLGCGDSGKIELPLSADYDERPRQKADISTGKAALTEYKVLSVNMDGTTDIMFFPHTGRTHQIRVHSAHTYGLGRPILGDLLYGGCGTSWSGFSATGRLHLHALSITFRHPATGLTSTFSTKIHCY